MHRFGAEIRREWLLEADVAFLNHGSFGATPKSVLDHQRALQDELETQPVAFMLDLLPRLRGSLDPVGDLLGASPDDLVFVDNATTGVNAVMRSLDLSPGDRILTTSWGYGAVAKTLAWVARRTGAVIDVAHLPFPVADAGIDWSDLRARIRGARVLVVDHIASKMAAVLPVEQIVAEAHAEGVPVLVDGAHAPGQIALDLASLGADWWVGNLHKWAFAPKGCAVLYVRPDRRQGLHPTVISHGFDEGLHAEFDWTGTRDPSAFLTAPAALSFLDGLGIDAMRTYQEELREAGLARLSSAWGVERAAPASVSAAMATLPVPFQTEATDANGDALRRRLWEEHRVEVPLFAHEGRLWLRFSAQVYNSIAEFERLIEVMGPDGIR